MKAYPRSYHIAHEWVINHGSNPSNFGRKLIAKALRDLRRMGGYDVKWEWKQFYTISGAMPEKVK